MNYQNYDLYETRNSYLSARMYNVIIGLVLLWGFGINAIMCTLFTDTFMSWNPVAVIIGYFIVAILGIIMSTKSDNPFISFIGYNMVVLPVGVVLSIFLTDFDEISIMNAFITTALVTLIMIILASIVPDIFLSMSKVLFVCLSAVVIIELILLFLGISTPTFWDWLIALLFCGYIGYDWAKAQEEPKTLDSAIDSVVSLYLDIINLFMRILSASKDD